VVRIVDAQHGDAIGDRDGNERVSRHQDSRPR
jgi:hypothetical protein